MATRAERTANKALNKRHTEILNQLARLEANRYCADCHKKGNIHYRKNECIIWLI
jgi:hypothetical protein